MYRIVGCESKFRQFTKSGAVLRGALNRHDIGLFQINETYHLDTSRKLGYDIYTLDGNIGYAKYLFKHYGTKPWGWSSKCWTR